MVIAAIQIAVFSPRSHTNVVQPIVHRESSAAFEDALVVRTNCGEYIGTIEDGAFVFKVSMHYATEVCNRQIPETINNTWNC